MSDHKFAEPVSLSSTLPTDLRLPPTAARLGFVLLALRARRNGDNRGRVQVRQGGPGAKFLAICGLPPPGRPVAFVADEPRPLRPEPDRLSARRQCPLGGREPPLRRLVPPPDRRHRPGAQPPGRGGGDPR